MIGRINRWTDGDIASCHWDSIKQYTHATQPFDKHRAHAIYSL